MAVIEVACPPPGHGQGEGPDVDKWSKTTQDTLGGAEVSEANGVHLNHCHTTQCVTVTTPLFILNLT